ncbi:MAG TPA: carboxypeptidase-like regulatory domain-containing protein [Vicinamibacterales bacterium]|nr:carboxypeptidase-like regulatory domain-containing protein [Vicinamibacterales bacterium]
MALGWTVLLLTSLALAGQQAQPPRDAPQSAATATIRGRITSAASGLPLHRVRLTLNGPIQNPPTAVTDTRGEFELADVPPGSFSLTATRAGYLTVQYGQRRPREAGRTIEVGPGETLQGIDMALPRAAVLAGRITDETGDPAPGVRVEALEHRYLRGRRVLVPARITSTNDAGDFRLSGLEPGSFQLRASSTDVWEGDDGKTTHVYAVTYFPGATGTDQPQSINLSVGQEVGGLDVQLRPGRAARVTGVVEDAEGQPLRDQVVYLSDISRGIGGRLVSSGPGAGPTRTGPRGAFEFSKLAPGEYIAYTGGAEERVSITVVVGDGDHQHLLLTPRKPAEFSGRIITDDGAPPPFLASRLRLLPVPSDPQKVLPLWGESSGDIIRPDWSFRIVNLEGPYLFRVLGLPDGWMLKAVSAAGRDITDAPFTVTRGGQDFKEIEIVLSQKGAGVRGEVGDAAGAPAPDSTVVIFSENAALWRPASRHVRAVRPDRSGRFSVTGLPAGVYRAIARDLVLEGQWEDPAFLQDLMKAAARIELAEGAVETVKLRVERDR